MPVAAHIDPASRIVMFRCSGHVVLNEAKRAFDHMMTDPSLQSDARAMWDMRAAVHTERTVAIPQIVAMVQSRHPERSGSCRIAILVAEELAAIAPSNTRADDAAPVDRAPAQAAVRIFSNYTNAARWLAGEDA